MPSADTRHLRDDAAGSDFMNTPVAKSPPPSRHLPDAAATLDFGRELAGWLQAPEGGGHDVLVYLQGDLGTGKTTLVRGILRALGFTGPVKSPTYTLLEPYEELLVYHFDLYRIEDGQELDFIGMDELLAAPAIKLVEWPERGASRLPPPDVRLRLRVQGVGRHVEVGT